ncbi:MAG TPA: YggT family protein [Gemmatimonadaceae bacterium]|nr:YggT family protein [Gemmatimonadaceae bacterium]
MTSFIVAYASFLAVLKLVVFALAVLLAVVFTVDWAVRARYLNPFGAVARFFRASVDPLIAPVERRVVRAGGLPTSAPWWALVAVVVGGILLITAVTALGGYVVSAQAAFLRGPAEVLRFVIAAVFGLLQLALLVRVVTSWVGVSPYSAWVRWSYVLTEPILRPLRRLIPTVGMLDVTPIVAYFVLRLLAFLLLSAIG